MHSLMPACVTNIDGELYSRAQAAIHSFPACVTKLPGRHQPSRLALARSFLRPEKPFQPPQLPRRDLVVVPGVVQEPSGHRYRLGVFVLEQIANLSLVFPCNFRIAVTGREITVMDGECAGKPSAFRDRFYLAAEDGTCT